jgi:acetyl-CoA synthetase
MTVDRYAELCAAHRWEVPSAFNIAAACCARWSEDRARFALYWEDEGGASAAFTFWDLQQRANRLSNALAALGIGRGDKVALLLPQRPETVIAHVALYQLGAVAVPLSFLFGPKRSPIGSPTRTRRRRWSIRNRCRTSMRRVRRHRTSRW